MMKAKEIILDFINYAFFLVLIGFCIFYFTIGSHFYTFGQFLKLILPLSLFGILFLINLKLKRNTLLTLDTQGVLNEILTYVTRSDLIKDKIAMIFSALSILVVNLFDRIFKVTDFLQAAAIFLFIFFWHKFLFRPSEDIVGNIVLRNIDKVKDEVAIYLIPLIAVSLGLLEPGNLLVDLLQGFIPLAIMLTWHFLLFREK